MRKEAHEHEILSRVFDSEVALDILDVAGLVCAHGTHDFSLVIDAILVQADDLIALSLRAVNRTGVGLAVLLEIHLAQTHLTAPRAEHKVSHADFDEVPD